MRPFPIIIAALLIAACTPPPTTPEAVDPASFTGNWYGIRPDGVTTFHSDSSFLADGEIVVRFFSCLSSRMESSWTDRGTWSYDNKLLTITLVSNAGGEDDGESYTHSYTLLTDHHDRRTFRSESADYIFWLQRRWRELPYDCTATKADLDADRALAQSDGRFQSDYPDYSGPDL